MPLVERKCLGLMSFFIVGMLVGACKSQMVSSVWSPLASESPAYSRADQLVTVVPTPYPGYGVVIGRLVSDSPVNLIGLSIFLGDIIVLNQETHAAFLNRQIAPVGRLDFTSGWFVFERVKPGLYALIISEPEIGSWVYRQSDDVTVVEVKADQVVNLGEIFFNPWKMGPFPSP